MSKKITILGCGYLGKALAEASLAMDWEVSAFTRNEATAKDLIGAGVHHVVVGRLEDQAWHSKLSFEQDYIVNCVGAAAPNLDGYRQSYLGGLRSINEWLKHDRRCTFIFTSSTSVYPQRQGEVVDETFSHSGVSERGKILLKAEEECMALNAEKRRSFVLRLAGLYGPGRHLLIDKVKRGETMSGSGSRILNLIHRDDAVKAMIQVLKQKNPKEGRIYNVSDNEWAKRREIVDWIAGALSVPKVAFDEQELMGAPNRKVSSDRIRKETGWSPFYSSFQKAYQEMLAS